MALSTFYFKNAIEKFGEAYIKELKDQLIKARKKATGELIQSLDYDLVEKPSRILLKIIANSYLIDVDQGRAKGAKRVDPSALGKWAKVKRMGLTFRGIKYKTYNEVGWAISNRIIENGIKKTDVLEKTRRIIMSDEALINELSNGALLDLNKLIDDTFNDLRQINIKKI
jgi:hypothetical protein